MQMCKDHWNKLREAISSRGMDHLVAKSGKSAMGSLVAQLEGTATKANFDPLMNANWAIVSAYLRDVGLAGMVGDKCPLCEVEGGKDGLADNWIDGACNDQLASARKIGLMPPLA